MSTHTTAEGVMMMGTRVQQAHAQQAQRLEAAHAQGAPLEVAEMTSDQQAAQQAWEAAGRPRPHIGFSTYGEGPTIAFAVCVCGKLESIATVATVERPIGASVRDLETYRAWGEARAHARFVAMVSAIRYLKADTVHGPHSYSATELDNGMGL